jgi:hypothetical protein
VRCRLDFGTDDGPQLELVDRDGLRTNVCSGTSTMVSWRMEAG